MEREKLVAKTIAGVFSYLSYVIYLRPTDGARIEGVTRRTRGGSARMHGDGSLEVKEATVDFTLKSGRGNSDKIFRAHDPDRNLTHNYPRVYSRVPTNWDTLEAGVDTPIGSYPLMARYEQNK